ncbi:MAG: cell division ATP-binding protein FtsE [Firmicutes bacterium]|nr:cell division ATP-binding protein FtsE [Bacillota bacterium]
MIYFKNVTKRYDENTLGLANASIHIRKGDFVFLIGLTGSGKSTFIKLILRELMPDQGSIIIEGTDITKLSNREIPQLRRKIGTVFQDYGLLPNKTVFENVAFAMEVIHKPQRTIKNKVPQILAMMGIDDKADQFPRQLSGGQQQRVAIARAIVNEPDILIADEPTGNLDPATAMEIMAFINMINKRGTTVIMATHDKNIVNAMHKRVVTIDAGYIVKDVEGGEYELDD